jgi:hypothetical protein
MWAVDFPGDSIYQQRLPINGQTVTIDDRLFFPETPDSEHPSRSEIFRGNTAAYPELWTSKNLPAIGAKIAKFLLALIAKDVRVPESGLFSLYLAVICAGDDRVWLRTPKLLEKAFRYDVRFDERHSFSSTELASF